MNWLAVAILTFVTAERIAELLWSHANMSRLLARGGREEGAGHYPLMVALHGAWLAGLWLLAWDSAVEPGFLAVFLVAQVGRAWVLWSLGRRWTTRVVAVPGETLIASGPYRYLKHPNYVVVAVEIAALPLAFGLIAYAIAFSILNAAVLAIRIRTENAVLSVLRQTGKTLVLDNAQPGDQAG